MLKAPLSTLRPKEEEKIRNTVVNSDVGSWGTFYFFPVGEVVFSYHDETNRARWALGARRSAHARDLSTLNRRPRRISRAERRGIVEGLVDLLARLYCGKSMEEARREQVECPEFRTSRRASLLSSLLALPASHNCATWSFRFVRTYVCVHVHMRTHICIQPKHVPRVHSGWPSARQAVVCDAGRSAEWMT